MAGKTTESWHFLNALSHNLLLFHSRLHTTHTRLPFPLLHVRVPPFVPFGNNRLVLFFFLCEIMEEWRIAELD